MQRAGGTSLRRLCQDRRGVAALEFSVIASFMVVMMLAAFDIGNATQHEIQLQAAVRAGGQFAMTFPTDASDIQTVVSNSLPNGWTLSAPATVACYCLNPTSGATTAQADCSAATLTTNCTGANAGKVISISATMPYSALTPVFANFITSNSATYVVRFQ